MEVDMSGVFEIKQATNGQFCFTLKAPNGEMLLTSEMYATKAGAHYGIASVMTNALLDHRFERHTSNSGAPYFVLTATNGESLARSDLYDSPTAMEHAVESVQRQALEARVDDLTTPTP